MSSLKFRQPAIDPGKTPALTAYLKAFRLDLELMPNTRSLCYKVWNHDRSHYILACFDVDITRIIAAMQAAKDTGRNVQDAFLKFSLFAPAVATGTRPVHSCAVCGKPGGLPSPNMLAEARKIGVKDLFDHQHLHPGHCRKKIREKLDYAKQHKTSIAAR